MNPVIAYVVRDARTGEWIVIVSSRAQARQFARECDGEVLEVRRAR